MLPRSRHRTAALVVVALLASVLLATGPGESATAAEPGIVRGSIGLPHRDHPKIQVLWFDRSWNYLGRRAATGNGYSLTLPAGTYRLQFVDRRPSYRIDKYAPTDVTVTVRANALTTRNVKMRRGGFITGTIRNGRNKPAAGARVAAANRAENSFETKANKRGEFAIGGLAKGVYSVFVWDRARRWVDKSTFAGRIRPGRGEHLRIRLRRPAGTLTTYLFTPDGLLPGKTSVTVTSKATGQWWTARAKRGTVRFRGLHPGRYTLKFDGSGPWLPATLRVRKAKVRSNRAAFGSVRLTRRGGWVTGTVVDAADPTRPARAIAGARVSLRTAAGREVASTTSSPNGAFTLSGPLTTQSGMSVVVTPREGDDSWLQGQDWCMFSSGTRTAVSLTTGRATDLGPVPLPRSAAPGQPDRCLVG